MILNQDMAMEGKKIKLRNTIDISAANSLVHDRIQDGGERNSNIHCLGHIPPEMWLFDPWLMQANKAKAAGDRQAYTEYVKKFFEVHTSLKMINAQKYWNGWCFTQ